MRKRLKKKAVRAVARAAYHRAMGEYESARIQYQRLWAICGSLASFGTVTADEWFRSFVNVNA